MSSVARPALAESKLSAAAGLVRARAAVLAIWIASLGWSLALFLVVRDQFLHFRLARYDLGNMVQAVWSTAHGRPLEVTNGPTGEQVVRLANHVDPILVLLAPLWLIAPTPQLLIAVQIVAVAAGAFPLFWLGRRRLGSSTAAACVALAYLAYPWTAWTAADAFHPVTLAIPLFLFCIWFLDTDRLIPFAVCAVLAAASGELMALGVAGLGIWYAFGKERRRAGLAIMSFGLLWSCLALLVVVPVFSGGDSVYYDAYDAIGRSPMGIARTALTHPTSIVAELTESRDLLYLALLSVPLAGAFLLAPGLAAAALPQLLANLLAGFGRTTDPHSHYVAGVIPFLFAALAVGLGRFKEAAAIRIAALVLTLTMAASVVGPWPGALARKPSWTGGGGAVDVARRAAVRLVPTDASVSATNRLGAHLSTRRYIYSVPFVRDADWIAVDTTDPWLPTTFTGDFDVPRFETFLKTLERSSEWRKVFEQGPVIVYRRIASW